MRPGENGGRVPAEAQPAPSAGPRLSEVGSGRGLLGSALAFVEEVVSSVWEQIEIYQDQRRLAMRTMIIEAAVGASLAVGAAVGLCAAALAMLRGLCGGLAELIGGRVWAGELVGGTLVLALMVGVLLAATRLLSRAELRRLEAKYDRPRPVQGQDARGAARSDGGGSAPADAGRDAAVR